MSNIEMRNSISNSLIYTDLAIKNDLSFWLKKTWNLGRLMPMASVATFALLFAMYSLVHNDYAKVEEATTIAIPDVSWTEPKIDTRIDAEEKPQRPEVVEQPPEVKIEPIIETNVKNNLNWERPVLDPNQGATPTLDTGSQPMPIVRINPAYPNNAIARGIEGYVDVMFDITAMGTTANIRIVGYAPSAIFNSSVLKAVRGWKYRPASDGGATTMTHDIRERINFAMEK